MAIPIDQPFIVHEVEMLYVDQIMLYHLKLRFQPLILSFHMMEHKVSLFLVLIKVLQELVQVSGERVFFVQYFKV